MKEECCNHNCNQGRDCPLRKTEKQSKFDGNNKVKELTDEEIGLLTTDPRFSRIESPLLLDFARAILRKASEK